MVFHAFFALAIAVEPNSAAPYLQSLSNLEQAYAESDDPNHLLGIAGVYEVKLGFCAEAMRAYRRFFDACHTCEAIEYGAARYRLAVERCTNTSPSPDILFDTTGNATRAEVLQLLQRARQSSPEDARKLMLLELRAGGEPHQLNEVRRRAFELIENSPARVGDVLFLLERIRRVDAAKAQQLMDQLLVPQVMRDEAAVRALREQAMAFMIERTPGLKASEEPRTCRETSGLDPGFLTVNSKPWGRVYVNGELAGETPVSRVRVPAGCATIRVINPESGKELVHETEIRSNKVHILSFDLDRSTSP